MTQEEIIKFAAEAGFKWPDICDTTIEQRLERFANLVVAAEREKCTGTQEFVTLTLEVVERALASLESEFGKHSKSASDIRTALEQPQDHVPDAGNMVPAGWKLVPVDATREMIKAGRDAHYEAEKRIQEPDAWEQGGFAKRAVRAAHVFQAMLDAAPHPPEHYDQQALDLCPTCGWKTLIPGDCCLNCARQKPQVEQKPVAWCALNADRSGIAYFDGKPIIMTGPIGNEHHPDPLYTNLHPKREPLTDEQIIDIADELQNSVDSLRSNIRPV